MVQRSYVYYRLTFPTVRAMASKSQVLEHQLIFDQRFYCRRYRIHGVELLVVRYRIRPYEIEIVLQMIRNICNNETNNRNNEIKF